ncbi:M48 family metallopeptidase [Hymenobacter sp. BT186]|uniref:M48 family metallopeptidase n=1 Tax=Hymenobacter telluris TaxID=2816474 RepID=A0A939EZP4_9BACT|nr:M48 family metallopeptidase [Hymenobacter telluris]MBO0360107.1 M48 family metallopeptidase [Hymenobacter telluris]MBW3376134.1 M48 family metallopeptidase [Hymenobacter norwichensis]
MFRYVLCLWLLCLGGRAATAQSTPYLPFYSSDTSKVYALAVAHRSAVKAHFVVPKTGNSEYREHYKRIVQDASTEVYNAVRYSALLDPVLDASVQQVFAKVVKANPQLPPLRLVLTKNPEPNARAVGNGTILLHVGLLPTLENESQLAFILCHEIAHIQARHMETTIAERLTALHSREMKREVRRIIQAEYNINSRMKALILGFSLDGTYHQRKHEQQADSLGYELLKRTPYDATQAHRALQLLDQMDAPATQDQLELGQYFSCASFAKTFNTAPAKPQSIFAVKAPEQTVLQTTDTLKSHPDCAKRMRYIRALAQGQVAEGPQVVAPEFAHLRTVSRLEVVQSWFDADCYDHALFDALLLLRHDPQNAYLRSVVQLSLYELRQHLINHRFTEVVSNVSTHNPANFNQLLTTLYGLHSTEYKGLSTCFEQLVPPASAADEYALAARYAAAALAEDPAQTTALQQQYLAQYKSGKFSALLFPTPVSTLKRK